MSKIIAVALLFGLISTYVPGGSADPCPRNEISLECKGCDQYCGQGPQYCTKICTPGCSCKKGYVRSKEYSNRCIAPELCRQIISQSPEMQTTEHKVTKDKNRDDQIKIGLI